MGLDEDEVIIHCIFPSKFLLLNRSSHPIGHRGTLLNKGELQRRRTTHVLDYVHHNDLIVAPTQHGQHEKVVFWAGVSVSQYICNI